MCGISKRKGFTYDIEELGWNYYMNQFSAVIGNEQLKTLDNQSKILYNQSITQEKLSKTMEKQLENPSIMNNSHNKFNLKKEY